MSGSHKPTKCSYQAPYPEIRVKEKNRFYAEILMDDFAGMVSEVTAINQYLFHHYMFEEVDEELAELLECIAIVEMHHMEMLAETITKLGGYPVYRGSYSTNGNFWNGSFVYYGQGIRDRIKANIESELKAIQNYKEHATIIDDPYIKELLARIILDEEHHIMLFNKALQKI